MLHTATGPAAAPLKRKIAAILAADVAGYSRLVADDEERTLRELAAARQIFDGRIVAAGGRIFNTAGDSVMCEFDSAVEAVRVAVAIQDALEARNATTEAARRLAFRIGITIGDVVESGGDLLGDGVNIASRLEGLAPPGGICVSRSVHEAVANKIPVAFTDLGPRQVKNIPQPIHAFAILPRAPAAEPADTLAVEPRIPRTDASLGVARRSGRSRLFASAAAIAGIGIAWSAWHLSGPPDEHRTGSTVVATAARDATPSDFQAPVRPAAPANPAPSKSGPKAVPETAAQGKAGAGQPARPAATPLATLREAYDAARAEEAKGDRAAALKAYAALAPLARDQVDPMLRYAALLRQRQGVDGTRRTLEELGRMAASRSATLVAATQGDPAQQVVRLEGVAAANPDYAPVDYLLAEAYLARPGGPTLTERRLAFDALDRFFEAEARLPAAFLDRTVLEGWIEVARRRRAEIETFFAGAAGRPRVRVAPTEAGWLAKVVLPEPASNVTLRIGEQGEAIGSQAAGGERSPNQAEIALPATTGRTTLYVTYQDSAGREAGPFPVSFDPAVARAAAARDTLEHFPETWVAFRPDLPDLLSYAQLAANRCGIARALIGFGDEPPSQALALPACDTRSTLPSPDPRPLVTLPAGVDSVQVQLAYADGTESRVRTFRRP